MAAIAGRTSFPEPSVVQIQWPSVTENDTFTASNVGSRYPDRGVTVQGTFGGATVTLQGSYDGTNYFTLHGQTGTLVYTTAGSDIMVEAPPYLKAIHSGGSSESVTITVRGVDAR